MDDLLTTDLRLSLPLDYLEAFPYPAFIFSRPGSALDPSTPHNARTDSVVTVTSSSGSGSGRGDGGLGSIPEHEPGGGGGLGLHHEPSTSGAAHGHLPLVWSSSRWAGASNNRPLGDCMDAFQANALRGWLSAGAGGAVAGAGGQEAGPGQKTEPGGPAYFDGYTMDTRANSGAGQGLSPPSVTMEGATPTESTTAPHLTVDLVLQGQTRQFVFVKTAYPRDLPPAAPMTRSGSATPMVASFGRAVAPASTSTPELVVVQCVPLPARAPALHGHGHPERLLDTVGGEETRRASSSAHSRVTDRYAVSHPTPFQLPAQLANVGLDSPLEGPRRTNGLPAEDRDGASSGTGSVLTDANLRLLARSGESVNGSSASAGRRSRGSRMADSASNVSTGQRAGPLASARPGAGLGWVAEAHDEPMYLAVGAAPADVPMGQAEHKQAPAINRSPAPLPPASIDPLDKSGAPQADVPMTFSQRQADVHVPAAVTDVLRGGEDDRSASVSTNGSGGFDAHGRPIPLSGRSAIYKLLKTTDWASVGLGPAETWDDWMQAIVNIVMQTQHESCYWHGDDLIMIYNSAYGRMAPRHPSGFGKPAREAWGDIWPNLEPLMNSVKAGKTIFRDEDLWLFETPGHPHKVETYHRLMMVPVMGVGQKCLGIYNTSSEETEQILARRRLAAAREITDATVHTRTQDEFFEGLNDAVSLTESARDLPYMFVYHVNPEPERQTTYFSSNKQTHRKVALNLATSIGVPLPHASVPLEMELQVPIKRAPARTGPGLLNHRMAGTASPSLSTVSSRRASSMASINSSSRPFALAEEEETPSQSWPFLELLKGESMVYIEDASALVQGFEVRCWDEVPTTAVAIALSEQDKSMPMAVAVIGLNYRRPFDETYKNWIHGLRANLSSGLAAVKSTETTAIQQFQTQQLERAKQSLFQNVAHELKTPLTLISAPIDDLILRCRDENSKALLKMVQRNAGRLSRLVNSIMDFSKLEAGKLTGTFRPTDVSALVQNIAAQWRSAVEKAGMVFKVKCEPAPRPISSYVDPELMEKILSNLLSNAFKYAVRKSGRIDVRLTYSSTAFELSVTDDGRGIKATELPYLTERFHRTPEAVASAVEGTGLGLAFSSELIRLHGGYLEVASRTAEESTDGSHGSTFSVTIPLGRDHLDPQHVAEGEQDGMVNAQVDVSKTWYRERGEDSSDSVSESGGSSVQSSDLSSLWGFSPTMLFFDKTSDVILVADDNSDMRKYVRSLLTPFVKAVLEAADGQEALALAKEHQPTLIISDQNMPRMTGTQLLKELRADQALAYVPVILLTAKAGEDDRVDALIEGADEILSKPFQTRELIARVNLHCQLAKRRKVLENQFAQRNAELQIISEYAPVGIVRSSSEGVLVWANDFWHKQVGVEKNPDTLLDWGQHVLPEDLDKLVSDWDKFINSDLITAQLEWRWKSGAWIIAYFTKLEKFSPHLKGTIGTTTDISEQKRHEAEQSRRIAEEVQRRREAVEQRQKHELLIDITSHELRNPISAVIQCSTLVHENLSNLRVDLENDVRGIKPFKPSEEILKILDEDLDALESVHQCGRSQSKICDDVLALGRIQMDILEIHPIPTVLRTESSKVLSVFAVEARRLAIELSIDFGPGVDACGGVILTDPVRLGQVYNNLISNGLRFTAASEIRKIHIHIDVGNAPPADDTCLMPKPIGNEVVAPGQDLYLYAAVKDTGPGLAPRELEKLFRRFSQASSETHTIFGGSGLGLFVCRKICELMGGRIEVASTYGEGSTFRFFIKVKACQQSSSVPAKRKASITPVNAGTAAVATRKRTCLVVEDNEINSKVLLRQLKKAGIIAEPAFNGLEGLQKIRASKYSYDCVLMDLEMPIMDGLTAVRQLRAEEFELGLHRNLVIALTGNAREQQQQNALDSGMDAVVIKPYSAQSLLDKIESMIVKTEADRATRMDVD